jgi:iodotyrosine deiodinase
MKKTPASVPLAFDERPLPEMQARAEAFADELCKRRTVRDYAPRAVSFAVIEHCIRAAASAPSGANRQPWHFVGVRDAAVKARIRAAAEAEEREFYGRRAPQEWLDALAPLGTDADKPFLDSAPYLIAIFYERHGLHADGRKFKTYYAPESVGIATGLLIAALHHAGLATLTHTPSPMGFLRDILGRPANETPFLLLVTGYPAADARVPAIARKALAEVMTVV